MEEKLIALQRPRKGSEDSLSDEGIAAACGTGDRSAITILYDRFHQRVARFIYRLNGRDQVDDLMQATFLEVVRGNTIYDGRSSVTTWLFSIATNIVRHHRRSFARKQRLTEALRDEPRPGIAHLEDGFDEESRIVRANAAMQELSETQRAAFVLCVLEGLSAKEAALALDTSVSAVWKRVCKARATLRRKVLEGAP
ncbi:RNA polymerase sigma factor [Myxococcota bacterium]|nr:RNA polymerase sigma factor [Myxococcota bacterium]